MKVYLCGAMSVGKTTLARYISNKYQLPMITEVARTILSEKELQLDILRTDLDMVDKYQTEIFYRQIEVENDKTNFVSDRSFDCLAFAAQHSRIFASLMGSSQLISYINSLKKIRCYYLFCKTI